MTKLIAEIGINHGGDLQKAIKHIKQASTAKVWGVKFQYRSDNFFADNDEMGSTLIKSELERSNLQHSWIGELINKSRENGLSIGFSFFRNTDLEEFFEKGYKIDFIKIPSAEFRNIRLIKLAKSKNIPVMVSYGGGSEDEIEKFIKLSKFDKNDCVFHCIANYPVALGNQQLSFIERLKSMTDAKIGYSSHDAEWEVVLLTLKYEIDFIERHICLSKQDLGLDISSSSDLNDFKRMNEIVTKYNDIFNSSERSPNQGEILNIRNLGTGLYFDKNYSHGDEIVIKNLVEKSPATGLRIHELDKIKKLKILKNANAGDPLLKSHIEANEEVAKNIKDFRNEYKISLPVRLHDFIDIKRRFEGKYFEMHLSYAEVFKLDKNIDILDSLVSDGDHISIHLPDYVSNDDLIDPFSNNRSQKKLSLELINICIEASKKIETISKNSCLILGSFSCRNDSKMSFYKTFKQFTSDIKKTHDVDLYAQWLPKKAWYFGGSVVLDQFCSKDDINFIKENDIKLCLDFSHLILSANYFNDDWYDWYNLLKDQIEHIHIADGEGDDGEGVEFGLGDLSHYKEILNHSSIKVLEVWEGHHNIGEKFYSALKLLSNNLK
jgi:N-acetylneuraminate synthase